MTYKETLDFLFGQFPMFQRSGKSAYKANLDNTIALDLHLGKPHTQFRSIHIAGTNGKGSVSNMLSAVFQTAGYKVGLYTSPHLKDFRERIRINGEKISEKDVVDFVVKNKTFFELLKPSFFEITVALAFEYFAKENIDVAVIEVGLGGRLDSTNIITPELSVITNIGLDHVNLLGNSLEKIAYEKSGIIKKNIPVVIGESQNEVKAIFTEKAKEVGAPIFFADENYSIKSSKQLSDTNQVFDVFKNDSIVYEDLSIDVLGWYQKKNVITVLKSIDILKEQGFNITKTNVINGLSNMTQKTGFSGRWQIVSYNPIIICDIAHNIEGLKQVIRQIKSLTYEKLHIVFGAVIDKNINKILSTLPKNATYYFSKADIPRALDENLLAEKANQYGIKGHTYSSVHKALSSARSNAQKNDLVFISGSTFIVAEIL